MDLSNGGACLICTKYRKHRSLGTPPRLTFQARLLHNREGANAEEGGFRKISSRALFRRTGRCSHLLGCGAIERVCQAPILPVCVQNQTRKVVMLELVTLPSVGYEIYLYTYCGTGLREKMSMMLGMELMVFGRVGKVQLLNVLECKSWSRF